MQKVDLLFFYIQFHPSILSFPNVIPTVCKQNHTVFQNILYNCGQMKKLFCAIAFVSFSVLSFGQSAQLMHADSLFRAGKYTESFSIYNDILLKDHSYSPAMLLKMAYIKEGLSQYSDALYYLNLHYLLTADQTVLTKMEQLAEARGFQGYDVGDKDFAYTFLYRYYPYIIGVLLALALLLLTVVFRERIRLKQSGKVPAVFMVLVLALVFFILNFGISYDKGIVMDQANYLMAGPSAGADVIDVIGKGHRLEINGHKDVWIKTTWDNRTVYVKRNKIRPVEF